MGETGHDRGRVFFCLVQQGGQEARNALVKRVTLRAHPQAEVGCDLIIARTASVQASARIAHQFAQAAFHMHVDVFQCGVEYHFAGFDLGLHLIKPFVDRFHIVGGDDALRAQHAGVRF